MHIIRLSFIVLICLIGSNISAQDSISLEAKDTFEVKHHVSIDASGLLKLFFSGGQSNQPPFFVSWRKLREGSNIRMGLALNLNVQSSEYGTNSFFAVKYKIGKERYTDFGKRWQVFYGWDFLGQISNQTYSEGDGNFGFGLGWGPVAGLHFKINDHLWVSTEANYSLIASVSNIGASPVFGLQGLFQAPNAILLGYRF